MKFSGYVFPWRRSALGDLVTVCVYIFTMYMHGKHLYIVSMEGLLPSPSRDLSFFNSQKGK